MNFLYRLTSLIILSSLSSFSLLGALDSTGQIDFNIRFYDRQIYYVESNPIYVQVTITNNSPAPYRFKLADDRVFSVDFDIRTATNRLLPHADALIKKRNQNLHVFFREVSIETGESFSFVEDLRDYVSFGQSGSYRIRAKVYPELFRSSYIPPIESNYLNLSIRPELLLDSDGIPIETDVSTGAALVKQRLPPDEVVDYTITARQQSQWEKFFLYLDPEAMLLRDPYQKRKYQAENENGRRTMLIEYRQNLRNAVVDGDIVTIPTTFDILKTEYNNDEGTVVVMQRYRMPRFTQLREFTYNLAKKDNYWIIVGYSTESRGTIAND